MSTSTGTGSIATAPVAQRPAGQLAPAGLFLGPATAVVLLVLVAPLFLLLRYSFDRFDPTQMLIEAVTPANFVRFFTDPFYLSVMRTTLFVSVVVTFFCLLMGMPIAYRLSRMQSRWKPALMLAVILPLFIGGTVRAVGWLILFARGGMLDILVSRLFAGRHVDMMYTTRAVIIGIISVNLPFVVLTLQTVIEGIDTRLEEAAQGLGAAPGKAFWRVVWPLALPGTLIAGILCFVLTMNAFATPYLVGGARFEMMAPLIYYEFASNNNWPFAAALSFILIFTTIVLTLVANRLVPRRYRT
jgi:putative spermidine/putrescine transport system permease protein